MVERVEISPPEHARREVNILRQRANANRFGI